MQECGPSGGDNPCQDRADAGNERQRVTILEKTNRQGVDHMKRLVLGLIAATAMTLPAFAADIKPAVIYDMGGKFDKSFNEAAYHGAEKFKKETGIAYRDFEISNDTQREQALEKFAQDGNSPIIAMSFSFEAAMKKVAPEYPKTQFVIVDDVVDLPNVRSVVFKENEGSYLVGVMAALVFFFEQKTAYEI